MSSNPYEQDPSYQQHVHSNQIPQDTHSSSDNPWASEGNPRTTYSTQPQPSHTNLYTQQTTYQPLSSNPPDPISPNPTQNSPYANTSSPTRPQHPLEASAYYSSPPPPHTSAYSPTTHERPPALPPRRSATDVALPSGSERAEQVETLQAYEAVQELSEDDRNQAILQREFPRIDGSLIAAIYGDSKSLSATRELLQELDDGGE
ncbi:hypothetical protein P154DRAFT_574703 [Amniculicola lignicola CBS 123094]|uniref:Uncharacterized protein n=1 Tax=Amniculicola lignicola CBS 123094 TaxID=1392246 RepID=A0A6A5WIM4_9PLEO|nr:hypothetical protein P154DRAFT_574703 [Amniculicola lignicola CBS 123094]